MSRSGEFTGMCVVWLGLVATMLTHDRPDTAQGRSAGWQAFWRVTTAAWLIGLLAVAWVP